MDLDPRLLEYLRALNDILEEVAVAYDAQMQLAEKLKQQADSDSHPG